jgi:hypothetical protein
MYEGYVKWGCSLKVERRGIRGCELGLEERKEKGRQAEAQRRQGKGGRNEATKAIECFVAFSPFLEYQYRLHTLSYLISYRIWYSISYLCVHVGPGFVASV